MLIVLTPRGQSNPALATALFFGVLAVSKLMSRFERAE